MVGEPWKRFSAKTSFVSFSPCFKNNLIVALTPITSYFFIIFQSLDFRYLFFSKNVSLKLCNYKGQKSLKETTFQQITSNESYFFNYKSYHLKLHMHMLHVILKPVMIPYDTILSKK